MTDDCSDGVFPDPDSSNNPELNCVLPLHNEFDFSSLEVLEGLPSPSPMATVRSFSLYEKVAELHFPALHSPYSGTSRLHRRQG